MRDILAFYGYVPLIAGHGGTAVEIARQKRPDLILLDIRLPDIDGTELAGQLKSDPLTRALPIVAVTAFAMPGDRERCLAAGMDDYITTPIKPAELVRRIEEWAHMERRPSRAC